MESKIQTALITGASGGIGYELAKLFARDHYNLVLVARSTEKLNQVAAELQSQFGVTVKTVALDLAAQPAPKFLFDQLQREGVVDRRSGQQRRVRRFWRVCRDAGGRNSGTDPAQHFRSTHLTRLFLPPMLARRGGKVMNVASTAAFQPGPLMAVYYATKAYVLSFSEALANEVAGSGVVVSCFCPGATDTGFAKRAGTENSRLFRKLRPMNAEVVARDGYRGLMAGRTLVISGMRNRLVAESVRFAPRRMVTAISRWVAEKVD